MSDDGWIERELQKIVRSLLARHPLRRGPYLITDAELRRLLTPTPLTDKEQT